MTYKPKTVDERIWSKVVKTDSCWLWVGPLKSDGYGHAFHNGKNMTAHRAAYEILVGPIPEGLEIDHLCRVRNCVNPAHMEPVTHKENVLRGRSVAVINKSKTHCPRCGGSYTPHTRGNGKVERVCVPCSRRPRVPKSKGVDS